MESYQESSSDHLVSEFSLAEAEKTARRQENFSGFSLVELSIVLVILGLLTGGILGGQSLIKAAELRSIGEEYKQWQIAVNTFKGKYNSLPGDTTIAERIWDPDGLGVTQDGNGDGGVDYAAAPSQMGEGFTFWQHLALAGLINGEFTGIAGSGSNEDAEPGVNVPTSKYGGGWSVFHEDSGSNPNATDWYNVEYGNTYQIGAESASWEMGAPLLAPEDAWNIDTKFDDGQPAKGMIIARYWNDLCAAADDASHSASDLESSYKLSDDSVRCTLAFRQAF